MYKSSETCYVLSHTPLGVQINKLYYICIDLLSDLNYITATLRLLYMALHVVLTYRCWTLYRITHSVYVLALIEPLHPPACVYSQMNHLSTSGGESSPFSTA